MTVYDQEQPPFLAALLEYCKDNILPLHTPGHKQGDGVYSSFKDAWDDWGLSLDIDPPVLNGANGLVLPGELLATAQSKAASLFGAKRTFFLTNGTTSGIQGMFLAVANKGRVVLPRHTHGSVLGALILSGVDPIILPPIRTSTDLPDSRLDLNQLLQIIKKEQLAGVFLQNPSYYGFASDLSSLITAAHDQGIPVLVDEAHGPHFGFSSELPPSALAQGADLVAQSTHKLLTSLTGSSMLHLSGDLLTESDVEQFLTLLQSSSPSFLLLASLESTVYQYQANGEEITSNVLDLAKDLRKRLSQVEGVKVIGEHEISELGFEFFDLTKVVIDVSKLGLTGLEVSELLREEYQIQVEMADFSRVLIILGPGDDISSISRLELAFSDLTGRYQQSKELPFIPLPPGGDQVLTPRDAYFRSTEFVSPQEAIGRISASIIAPYPPGIPVVIPGEVITKEQIEYLVRLTTFGFNLIGSTNGIRVVRGD